ncbi:MAG: ankyrin repeat domain-containing protein [Verrucomicrobiota bacterium JB023]|nr:ankyrin repeat domain-containing protein [Verrucomicrobiota bacterium JB023]
MSRHLDPETIVAAIVEGDSSVVDNYLQAGGDPDLCYHTRSLFHSAAQESDFDVVRLLLDRGALTEIADDEGHFPLYQAAAEGATEVARLLVEKGASINRVCESGSAHLIACVYGHHDVVRYWIGVGADPDLPDPEGATARLIAESDESQELLRILNNG